MRTKLTLLTSVVGAAVAAVAIAAAPTAAASVDNLSQSCSHSATQTVCQSPGNVQITATPPAVNFYPYGYGYGYGGGFGYAGGFPGYGFHGYGGGHR